jgi:hypothetical protein
MRAALAVALALLGGCHDWEALSAGPPPPDFARPPDGPLPLDGARGGERDRSTPLPDAGPRDRAPDSRRVCSWTGSFSLETPQALAALNTSSAQLDPFLTFDNLTLYFASDLGAPAGFDFFMAKRATPASAFGAPTPLSDLNSSGQELRFALSADGLTAYVATEGWAGGVGEADLWYAVRASAGQPFARSSFKLVPQVNTTGFEYDPLPSADGLRLYYAAYDAAASMEVFFVERKSPGSPFSAPAAVPGINTAAKEDNPALSGDERVIVFGSDRPGTAGVKDLWYAVRADRSASFSTPARVPVVNSDDNDMEPFLSADGCELFFSSNRPGGKGNLDLYRARYLP